jgi:hypothetical protein
MPDQDTDTLAGLLGAHELTDGWAGDDLGELDGLLQAVDEEAEAMARLAAVRQLARPQVARKRGNYERLYRRALAEGAWRAEMRLCVCQAGDAELETLLARLEAMK